VGGIKNQMNKKGFRRPPSLATKNSQKKTWQKKIAECKKEKDDKYLKNVLSVCFFRL